MTITLHIRNCEAGDVDVLSVEVDDDRVFDDHAMIGETAEQVIADAELDYRVVATSAAAQAVARESSIAYVVPIA